MERKVHIIAELKQISPYLADMSNGMPQSVPNGYFDSFSEEMLKLAKEVSITMFRL